MPVDTHKWLEKTGPRMTRMNADGWGVVCQRMNDRPALRAKPKRRPVAALQTSPAPPVTEFWAAELSCRWGW